MREKIKAYLLGFTEWAQYRDLLAKYADYILTERNTYGNVGQLAQKNTLIAFVIRCNERISFNDAKPNNDLLVIVEYVSSNNYNVFTFKVTADPKTKKPNIAHLLEQVYKGNVRPHRWIAGRQAICSDNGCWFKRTTSKGIAGDSQFGQIGINIHDTGGFFNSSLGCVILESDSEYKNVFKPLLKRASNYKNILVAVINQDYFTDELGLV